MSNSPRHRQRRKTRAAVKAKEARTQRGKNVRPKLGPQAQKTRAQHAAMPENRLFWF